MEEVSENKTEANAQTDFEPVAQTIQQPEQPKQLIRKFELAVYDVTINDATGKEEYRPIAYTQPVIVEAASPKDLKEKLGMYRQCGQYAKVVREIDRPSDDVIRAHTQETAVHRQNAQTVVQTQVVQAPRPQKQIYKENSTPVPKREVKYYRVGDIDIKDDNGKLYQKQWMKLTDSEASNFRIINDKNNSIVNLVGKHIEMKKWIAIENSNDDETTNLEEILK